MTRPVSAHREILAKASAFAVSFLLVLPLAGTLFGRPASAQEGTPLSPEACVGIASDAERLACYDRAMGHDRRPGEVDEAPPELMTPAHTKGGEPVDSPVASSLLDSRWELSRKAKLGTFGLRAYKPVYLLPSFYTDSPNQRPTSPAPGHSVDESENQKRIEAKFQIGFKTKILQGVVSDRGDLWFGYTQSSRWQVYNSATSRPFRETNYEPELMLVFPAHFRLFGMDGRLLGASFNHQSNGRSVPQSRSWNRLIGMIGLEHGAWSIVARPWWRIPEPAGSDDNPDIEDYVGRGDLTIVRRLRGHEVSMMLRHSFSGSGSSRGAVELGWVFPIHRDLKGFLQIFHGYGESLIDYNQSATRVGLGISLLEWY
ncbi:MAG: phospholipase A [Thermoanaerobaculia bacterium]